MRGRGGRVLQHYALFSHMPGTALKASVTLPMPSSTALSMPAKVRRFVSLMLAR